ncbi:nickel/cobalt transporter [Jejubacter calystegiae]|uniref:Nickel/cobalt efflux system n=1 Tax=Jejubacter calystegiae TaxID=2579935 RepID=A0A4P8YQ33_9ENTR|nr:nickel/cobalt transporter [Jejubacter calystegiae]QCT22403.1 nickel/cobalt transporter [Jejubacter calystegiae]
MSVINNLSSPPGRRWLAFWPLALLILAIVGAGVALWLNWPQLMLKSTLWQREVNGKLSALLQAVAENPVRAGSALLLFSFAYGVLHALGPGHGKVVMTTWLATHPSRLHASLGVTLASSLLQGLVAIALVSLVLWLLALPVRTLHLSAFWLEKGSYLLVALLGVMLCWRALRRLRGLLRRPVFLRMTPHHQHSATCGCGHQHLPSSQQMEEGGSLRERILLVLSMGMRPCSGAIVVLLFSKVIDVFWWGVAAVMAMSAGTSLTISGLALLVHSCRQLAQRMSVSQTPALWQRVVGVTLALAGGVILVAAGIMMWLAAAQPVGRGLRPF